MSRPRHGLQIMAGRRQFTPAEIEALVFAEHPSDDDDVSLSDFEEGSPAIEVAGKQQNVFLQDNEGKNFECFDEISDEEDNDINLQLSSDDEIEPINRREVTKSTNERKVHNLESSLNSSNYDELDNDSHETNEYKVTLQKKTKNIPEKNIIWTSERPESIGRQSKENIVRLAVGTNDTSKDAKFPIDAWNLFFSDEILHLILSCTNKRIGQISVTSDENSKYKGPTDILELRAFVGLKYARGLLKQNYSCFKNLFQEPIGHPIFGATMAEKRFQFLNKNICFDDKETRGKRFPTDRFAAVREIFEKFNSNCSKSLNPCGFLSLDETLYPCRNKLAFKQYNPNKPARYGILFKSINSAKYPYTHIAAVYAGKPTGDVTAAQFYEPGTVPIIKSLVNGLSKNVSLAGNNITMDRLYTSYEVFNWLLDQNITAVGTIMANKKEVPFEVKETTNREPLSYESYWNAANKKMSLHSYVVKTKSNGMKNVLLLSTFPTLMGVTKDENRKKPAIYKMYDYSKGGTDVVDQKMSYYSTNTKSARWTLTVFAYMLDTARVNSQTLFCLNNNINPGARNNSSFRYGWNIVLALVTPHLQRRAISKGLHYKTHDKIKFILSNALAQFASAKVTPEAPTCISGMSTAACEAPASMTRGSKTPALQTSAGKILTCNTAVVVTPTSDAPEPAPVSEIPALEAATVCPTPSVKKRCTLCVTAIYGKGYTKSRNKLAVVSQACFKCQKPVCKKHYSVVCLHCK